MVAQNKTFHTEETQIDISANSGLALQNISHILRMAGSGCRDDFPPYHNNSLSGQNCDFNNILTIANRTDRSDKLTVIAAIRYSGKIGSDSPPGTDTITFNHVDNDEFNTEYKKYFSIAPSRKQLFYEITSIESGENGITLSRPISAHSGDRIYRVNAYTIALDTDDIDNDGDINDDFDLNHNNAPDLYIYNNASRSYVHSSNDLRAEGIEDLQFRYGIDTDNNNTVDNDEWLDSPATGEIGEIVAVKVFILARSIYPDREYIDTHDDNPSQPGKQYVIADHTITLDSNDGNGINSNYDHHFHRSLMIRTVALRNMHL